MKLSTVREIKLVLMFFVQFMASSALGMNGGMLLSATSCPAGQVAIGMTTSRNLLCAQIRTVSGPICISNTYLYSYDTNGNALCVSATDRDPMAALCDHNREVQSYDTAMAMITCMRMPAVRPDHSCPLGEWVTGTWGGVVSCSGGDTPPPIGDPKHNCPVNQYIASIENGVADCKDILIPVASTQQCSPNQAIVGLSGGNIVCQDLMPAPHPDSRCLVGQFAQSQSTNQVNCVPEPEQDLTMYCPEGKYLAGFSSTGPICQNLPTNQKFNGTCSVGQVLLGYAGGQAVCQNLMNPVPNHMCPKSTYLNSILGSLSICIPFDDKAPCRPGFELDGGVCVDRTPPVVTVTMQPVNGPSLTAVVEYEVTDQHSQIASVSCKLDGTTSNQCQSPVSLVNLAVGLHQFVITAKDSAGNTTSKSIEWTVAPPSTVNCKSGYSLVGNKCVDITPPVVVIKSGPGSMTTQTDAHLIFSATDTGSGIDKIECSVDGGAYKVCVSPFRQIGFAAGAHAVKVRATDKAGNRGEAVWKWTVVRLAPVCKHNHIHRHIHEHKHKHEPKHKYKH